MYISKLYGSAWTEIDTHASCFNFDLTSVD